MGNSPSAPEYIELNASNTPVVRVMNQSSKRVHYYTWPDVANAVGYHYTVSSTPPVDGKDVFVYTTHADVEDPSDYVDMHIPSPKVYVRSVYADGTTSAWSSGTGIPPFRRAPL